MGIGGELDIAAGEVVARYVRRVIDGRCGPAVADLTALGFCGAGAWAAAGSPGFIADDQVIPQGVGHVIPHLVLVSMV